VTTSHQQTYHDRFVRQFGSRDDLLPALSAQRRFAVITAMTGRRTAVPIGLRLPAGVLDADSLADLMRGLVDNTPALRVRVEMLNGTAVQLRTPDAAADSGVVTAGTADGEREAVRCLLDDFETGRVPSSVAARLMTGANTDLLVLVFDHSAVDESSLRMILARLAGEGGGSTWAEYAGAVRRHAERELAAAGGVSYWARRLERFAGSRSGVLSGPVGEIATASVPVVPVAKGVPRPLLFPQLLAACHQALRDLRQVESTVVGYAWGGRHAGIEGVIGCFMNTVVSVCDTDRPSSSSVDSVAVAESWLEDLSHLDVPFDELVLSGPWRGEMDALIVFEDVSRRSPLLVAGHPAQEQPCPALTPKAALTFSARLDVHGLDLLVGYDAGTVDREAALHLCEHWRRWVVAAIGPAVAGERGPDTY
jgi:hypothetical protein